MKNKSFFYLVFLVGFILFSNVTFSQEKKALDAFINATTKARQGTTKSTETSEPVPGAEITVEQVRPKTETKRIQTTGEEMEIVGLGFEKKIRCKSNDKGEFSFTLSTDEFQKLPDEFYLRFTIKPKDPRKFPVATNSVIIKIKKPASPTLEFVVIYEKPAKSNASSGATNKGTFAVNSKAQT